MSRSRWLRVVGGALVLAALLGFGTVADDLRHVDELFQVGAVLVSGLALLAAGCSSFVSSRLAVPWLVLGLGAGTLIGTALGRVPMGFGAGAALGLVLASALRRRPPSSWRGT